MLAPHAGFRLGKTAVQHDARTLQLAAYTGGLPTPPAALDWTKPNARWPGVPATAWGPMGNLTIGDCAIASAAHLIQLWTADEGTPIVLSDKQVLDAYSAITGYDPARPETDQGSVAIVVLKYWRRHGIAGHKITGFAQLEPSNTNHVKDTIECFGGAYIGLLLPKSAQRQTTWSVVAGFDGEPGSWGGHAVPAIGYDHRYVYFVSWGKIMRMTWGFWLKYCDEAYAVQAPEWTARGTMPLGFDSQALEADLKAL